jgi:hypothetical protein
MMAEPSRRFPTPWQTDKLLGSYVVRDANGQALAYLYSRDNPTEAGEGAHEGRGAPHRRQHRAAAGAAWEGGARLMATLTDEQLRALRILARHPDGCAEGKLLTDGFSIAQLSRLDYLAF